MNNAAVICNHCPPPSSPPLTTHLWGWTGANVRGIDLSSFPTVPGKCQACDIMLVYPHGIYYYKEQGYDSQQVPVVQGF